jgi:hypothetical protein
MRPLRAPDGRLVAVRHNNKEINVTVIVWFTPGVRAIKPDLLGLKFRHEPPRGCCKQVLVERFHRARLSLLPRL